MNNQIISIIPARGGSKGIPRKNIIKYKGLPLIAHSIKSSLSCSLIDRTFVSTDDKEIANIAKQYGAEVPIMRPSELAQDETLDLPVFEHMLSYIENNLDIKPNLLVHLRPTSPIRPDNIIENSISKLLDCPNASSIRSVTKVRLHPFRMYFKSSGDWLIPYDKSHPFPDELRRQDLHDLYYYNCCVDITRASTIKNYRSMTGPKMLAYPMNDFPIDIDEKEDID